MDIKKILAFVLALLVAVTCLAACGDAEKDRSDNDNSKVDSKNDGESLPAGLLNIDGKEVDTDGLIVMTIDGIDVPFDEYRYMYKYVDSVAFSGGSAEYWNDFPDQFPQLLSITEGQLLENHWGQMLANLYGIELTDEDYEEMEEYMQEQRDSFESEEEYYAALEESAITEDLLRRIVEQQLIGNRAYEELYYKEDALLAPDDDTIKADLAENYVRVYHVLVSFDHYADDENYADADDETLKTAAKAYAESLLTDIQNGADIYELAQIADDPGMIDNEDGYFFTYDYMVKPFEEAAFALQPGELSGLVETDYGYHIILRLEQDQFVEDNWEEVRGVYINQIFNETVDEMLDNAVITYWEDYDKITYDSIN